MSRLNKITISIFILALSFFMPLYISAASLDNVKSDKIILYNLDENTILYEKNSEEETSIASLTKIMTVLVALERIDNLDEKVTITYDMIKDITWDVAIAGFEVGDIVTYRDLIYGAILPSGADAVNALAISVSGDFNSYVKLMNEKVVSLGLEHTHFMNVTGLDKDNHYSTAKDMSVILMEALKNPIFAEVYKTSSYTSTTGLEMEYAISRYNNTFANVGLIKGLKTGFTTNAQYCMSSIGEKNGSHYLLILLNATSLDNKPYHITDTIEVYKYFSDNYSIKEIATTDVPVYKTLAEYTKEKNVDIYPSETITKYLANDINLEKLEYKYSSNTKINYKTKTNTEVGTIKIYLDEELLGEVAAVIKDELNFSLWNFVKENIVLIMVTAVFILLIFRIIQVKIRRLRRKK